MTIQTFTTPSGDKMVVLPQAEYQDLIDAYNHAIAMRDIAAGNLETLTTEEALAYVAETSPLRFWRHKRGLSQAALASQVGISQAYLAQIETGVRAGDVPLCAKLAKALRIRMEDLVID